MNYPVLSDINGILSNGKIVINLGFFPVSITQIIGKIIVSLYLSYNGTLINDFNESILIGNDLLGYNNRLENFRISLNMGFTDIHKVYEFLIEVFDDGQFPNYNPNFSSISGSNVFFDCENVTELIKQLWVNYLNEDDYPEILLIYDGIVVRENVEINKLNFAFRFYQLINPILDVDEVI